MDQQQFQREYYIDWLRVLAFIILIFFHCSMPFVQFNWEIKNETYSIGLSRLIIWLHQWRLPLLFFISGVGVSFSLRKRSVLSFFGERVVRLFIPLIFAMFFTIPLQVYFEYVQKGRIEMSYAEFYPTVWDMIPYPEGSLTWSHMWFVVYLFVFTILLLPIFGVFKIEAVKKIKQKLNWLVQYPIGNLLFALPFMFYYFTLYVRWPEQGSLLDDWFVFTSSITFYFFGFFLADLASFWETCEEYRRLFLTIAIACSVMLMWKFYWPLTLPKKQDEMLHKYGIVDAFHIWSIILTAIGFARKYLNFTTPMLAYLTSAVYPYYILHQTIIVAVGFYVVQLETSLWIKLIVLIVACLSLMITLYHFLIKPFMLTRVLFGLKARERGAKIVHLN